MRRVATLLLAAMAAAALGGREYAVKSVLAPDPTLGPPEREADAFIRKARLSGVWSKEDATRNRSLEVQGFKNRALGIGSSGTGVYAAGPWGSWIRDPVPGTNGKPFYHLERYDGLYTMQFEETGGAPTLYPGDVRGIQREDGDRLVLTGYLDRGARPMGSTDIDGHRERTYEFPAPAHPAPGQYGQRLTVVTDPQTGNLLKVFDAMQNPVTKVWDRTGEWTILQAEPQEGTWLVREAEVVRSWPGRAAWRTEHYTFNRETPDPELPLNLLAGMPNGMNVIDHTFGFDHQIDYKYNGKRLDRDGLLAVKRERERYASGFSVSRTGPSPVLFGSALLLMGGAVAFGRRGRSPKKPTVG